MGNALQNHHAVLILAVIVLTLFLPAMVQQDAFPTGYDFVRHRSYLFTVAHQAFQQTGELPLWDPHTLAGFPYIANPHEQLFFPLNALMLIISPDYLFFPFLMLFTFLAGACAYALARRWLPPFPSLITAISYMLSGTLIGKIHNGVLSYFEVICLLPLLFFALQLVREQPTVRRTLSLAALWGLLLTINNMQLFLYSTTAAGIFLALQLAYTRWRNARNVLGSVTLAGVLAMLLASVVLLPLAESMAYSTISREVDPTFQTEGSLPPLALAQFILPWAFGAADTYFGPKPWGVLYNYIGILTLLLACVAVLHTRNSVTKTFLWLMGFSLIFSLGRYTPLSSLTSILPGFSLFRFPAKMLVVFVFAITLLAGFGAHALRTRKFSAQLQLRWRYALGGCFAIALITTLGIYFARVPIIAAGESLLAARYAELPHTQPLEVYLPLVETIYGQIRTGMIILTALLGISGALLSAQLRRPRAYFCTGVAFVLLADLLLFSIPLVEAAPRSALFQNPLAEFLAERQRNEGVFRVLDTARALPQDTAVRYGIHLLDGYHTNHLSYYTDLTNAVGNFTTTIVPRPQIITLDLDHVVNQNILDMLNVRYVLTPKPVNNTNYRLVHRQDMRIRDLNRDGSVYVYENLGVLPRAFTIPLAIAVPDPVAALGDADLRRTVLLENPVRSNGIGEMTTAEIVSYTSNRVTISTQRDSPGYLILGDMWYPGWRAFDNGAEVPVLKANGGIRAVPLTPGLHTVTFAFLPRSYLIGKWISLSALLLTAVLWVAFPGVPAAPKQFHR